MCWCDVVQASLQEMQPSDVKAHQPALLELFFTALDYRAQHSDDKVGHCPSPLPPPPSPSHAIIATSVPHSPWTS